MSLIEDALRMQERESRKELAEVTPAAPALPPQAITPAPCVMDPAPRPAARVATAPVLAPSFQPPAVSPALFARPVHPAASRPRKLVWLMRGGTGVLVLLLLAGGVLLLSTRRTADVVLATPAPSPTRLLPASKPTRLSSRRRGPYLFLPRC